jgi:glutaminyl-tRNA synthetase
VIKAEDVIKDDKGEIIEVRCSYDTETLNKNPADGRKVKGVIHWVSTAHAVEAEIRLYDRLFDHANPEAATKEGKEFTDFINPESLEILTRCYLETNLENAEAGERFQFEREGYFCRDSENSSNGKPVFNRTVTLRDTWDKSGKN